MDLKKCEKCLWKTIPVEGRIVCLFSSCIFENMDKSKEDTTKKGS